LIISDIASKKNSLIFWNRLKNENINDLVFLGEDDNSNVKEIKPMQSEFRYISPEKELSLHNQNFRKIKKEIAIPKDLIRKKLV